MRLQSVRAISVAAAAFLVCVACGGTTFASPTVSPAASLGRPTGQPVASVTSQPTGDPAFGGQATAAVVVGGVSHIIDGGRCVSTPDGFVITVGAAQYPIDLGVDFLGLTVLGGSVDGPYTADQLVGPNVVLDGAEYEMTPDGTVTLRDGLTGGDFSGPEAGGGTISGSFRC